MTTPQSVEEIIKEFIHTVWCSRLKEFDYTTDDEEERAHPTDMFVNWLRAHLTTYGNARYEEGVKEERERLARIIRSRLPDPMTDEEMEEYHCEGSVLYWGSKLLEQVTNH